MKIIGFRKYARVEVEIPVHFVSDTLIQAGEAYINNLSEEGGSLVYEFELPVATTLEFDIALPQSTAPSHVRADVLWSRPIQENGQNLFAHGLQFSRIAVDDRARLHSFVESAMSY